MLHRNGKRTCTVESCLPIKKLVNRFFKYPSSTFYLSLNYLVISGQHNFCLHLVDYKSLCL